MRFSVVLNPMLPWGEVLETAAACDRVGWDGVYLPDHLMPAAPDDGPFLECWTSLAALAAGTDQVRLGTLVSGVSLRHPAVLANAAVTLDVLSRGRFVLGVGAGWQASEHAAYGIELLDVAPRMDRFEEACEVVRSLLHERRTTFHGTYFHLDDAPCDPKPVHGHLPLLVGGGGERRTLRIAARFADEWNTWADPRTFAHKKAVLGKHCVDVGRDPAELSCSTQALVFVSEHGPALAQRQDEDWDRPRVFGRPAEVIDQIGAYEDVGVDEFIVPVAMMGSCQETLEMLDLFWTEVAVYFR